MAFRDITKPIFFDMTGTLTIDREIIIHQQAGQDSTSLEVARTIIQKTLVRKN